MAGYVSFCHLTEHVYTSLSEPRENSYDGLLIFILVGMAEGCMSFLRLFPFRWESYILCKSMMDVMQDGPTGLIQEMEFFETNPQVPSCI